MAWLTPVEEVPYPKKVWKVITSTFKSKLRCLRRPKCLIKTTKSNILARISASKPSCHHHHHHVHLYYHEYSHQELPTQRSFPSVHVPKSLLGNVTENQKDTAPVKENSVESMETMENYDEDDWQDTTDHFDDDYDDHDHEDEEQYVFVETSFNSKRLVLCGVNAKSESFIRNFYEGLKLEGQIN